MNFICIPAIITESKVYIRENIEMYNLLTEEYILIILILIVSIITIIQINRTIRMGQIIEIVQIY